ncbi:hypothetical protein ACQ7DA_03215 [Zafaria sp. J156]|uniref:hypothetical protein n=1 Tax=Zafaria sp. J156 TaxID=3116490 RepID=UPI002E785587|nr:hypothetical protein [Zafaria sp. J156]MEE1621080.1 hypothetical protein [Zafaria sp. J156]
MVPRARTSDRTLWVVLAVTAALVAVALAAVLTRGGAPRMDPATPAGTVQLYAEAVLDGDTPTAAALLAPTATEGCGVDGAGIVPDGTRVALVSTRERATSADVTVDLSTTSGGGLFGASEYSYEAVFTLVREGDAWLITSGPWELSVCPEPAESE